MASATDVRVKSSERRDNEIDKIYRQLIKYAGSDLHMQVGKPPILRVRGTLRDAVSYLFVELLADSALWTPEQSNTVYQLDLIAESN